MRLKLIFSTQALQQMKQGHISAKELCEKCIERSVKVRELNAFITETHDVAREQLKAKKENHSRTSK